ncbi:related to L-2,3-butanediol dehydrogenase [Saccharomycodes ludwigii]|uniref:Related to L-2,3-butanediol dehydrogenase n=1 Tax=Saccharomycodes ludwigii TaxID=36035 RepID=A0A376B9E5_9ASCO|nr:related to L-2,3-butanediol dehydrogenase [Saccharomycodes ludwigii]
MSCKTAFVTGGSQGIGAAIAITLASKGFQVAIGSRNEAKAQNVLKAIKEVSSPEAKDPIFVNVDVSDKESVNKAVDEVAKYFGSFDVMINNAGIAKVHKLLDVDAKEFDQVMDVNVKGVLYGMQAAAKKMIELNRKGDYGNVITQENQPKKLTGKIINCCSIGGNVPMPMMSAYTVSKYAVKGLTAVGAKEFAPYGITVNAYAPGPVLTPMWDDLDAQLASMNGLGPGENLKAFIESIALKRGATAQDIANLVGFLASDASDYITGQNYVVDGGLTCS